MASWRLCTGCGACAQVCPEKRIEMVDFASDGIRPVLDSGDCGDCGKCLEVCPGYETVHGDLNGGEGFIDGLKEAWGPVLEIWEGYAADDEIRYNGSSGGLISALALYCLEREGMYAALHTGADVDEPWKNRTVLSRDRADLLSRTGSRYSPASPCDGLPMLEAAPGPCVFVGKPCDVAGICKARRVETGLDGKIGLSLGIFCAGTPSTSGTLQLMRRLGAEPGMVEELRYRGRGWPGSASVRLKGEGLPSRKMPYIDSWGLLQRFRPFRCYLCPDGTSEFADISCGDPWHRGDYGPGYSLALVRTGKGRGILHKAAEAGYVFLERAHPGVLEAAQKNLFLKRGAIWGRLFAMKAFFIPTPRLGGFSLLRNWLRLPRRDKVRSVMGTVRRIIRRGYQNPITR